MPSRISNTRRQLKCFFAYIHTRTDVTRVIQAAMASRHAESKHGEKIAPRRTPTHPWHCSVCDDKLATMNEVHLCESHVCPRVCRGCTRKWVQTNPYKPCYKCPGEGCTYVIKTREVVFRTEGSVRCGYTQLERRHTETGFGYTMQRMRRPCVSRRKGRRLSAHRVFDLRGNKSGGVSVFEPVSFLYTET